MRIAWFTPLPPTRSGISAYSAELLPRLANAHTIDVFVDAAAGPPVPGVSTHQAHDFVWRHLKTPYDLVVYQLGNAPCHDYMWPYLTRYPGLVVLHDGQLHHARAWALLKAKRADDYRAEFSLSHPDARPDIAEYVVAGLAGSPYFFWPMLGVVLRSARLVAVHNRYLAGEIRGQHLVDVAPIRMGVAGLHASPTARESLRARYGVPPEACLFGAFGRVTPEKRIGPLLDAVRPLVAYQPDAHLLLVGETADYFDPREAARERGLQGHVSVTGFVPDEQLADHLAAIDVCLCLRWPTSRETSASWLRCLAAGKPTVTTDLVHMAHVPTLDPRSWTVISAPDGPGPLGRPVAVSIDILDEVHSTGVAMRRLAQDAALRQALGDEAQRYWRAHHTLDLMAEDYLALLDDAVRHPEPDLTPLPAHLRNDGQSLTRTLLEPFGIRMGWD